jgi:hypothetical protein
MLSHGFTPQIFFPLSQRAQKKKKQKKGKLYNVNIGFPSA